MSGGSFDYFYSQIEDKYVGFMEDEQLNDMMKDIVQLLHDLEWYTSGDTSKNDYNKSVDDFKSKWFKQSLGGGQ
jgi:hypothetical protein